MTPTQELEAKLAHAEYRAETLRDGVEELLAYVTSEKFYVDGMVNTADIIAFVHSIRAADRDAQLEPFGWAHPIGKRWPRDWDYTQPASKHAVCCSEDPRTPY